MRGFGELYPSEHASRRAEMLRLLRLAVFFLSWGDFIIFKIQILETEARAFSSSLSFFSLFFLLGNDGKGLALPPPKIERPRGLSRVHRCGTSIYRKKIDTQKV